jgi:stage III sporulation protein AG
MKQWLDKIRDMKKDQILILFLVGVLLLVIVLPTGSSDGSDSVQTQTAGETEAEVSAGSTAYESETAYLEERLRQILSQVDGIGQADVMLTLKSDGKSIVEKDQEQSQREEENSDDGTASSSSERSSSESTVYQKDASGSETPYVTETLKPEIEGVLVIAEGAGNGTVVSEITEAVMALFGVEAHKIKVMKMK